MSLDKPKRRRCAYKRCRRLLPKDATSRRRYCGPTCVAGAYRMRRRQERAHQMMTVLVDAKAAEFLRTTTGPEERLLARQTCGGPNCRIVLWAGVGGGDPPGTAARGAVRPRTGRACPRP
jgi:hypothetical protein